MKNSSPGQKWEGLACFPKEWANVLRELFKKLPTTYSYFKTEAECERQIPAQYSVKLMNLASFPLEIWRESSIT